MLVGGKKKTKPLLLIETTSLFAKGFGTDRAVREASWVKVGSPSSKCENVAQNVFLLIERPRHGNGGEKICHCPHIHGRGGTSKTKNSKDGRRNPKMPLIAPMKLGKERVHRAPLGKAAATALSGVKTWGISKGSAPSVSVVARRNNACREKGRSPSLKRGPCPEAGIAGRTKPMISKTGLIPWL